MQDLGAKKNGRAGRRGLRPGRLEELEVVVHALVKVDVDILVCMYVYIYIYIYVFILCLCIYIYIYIHIYTNTYAGGREVARPGLRRAPGIQGGDRTRGERL